MENKRQRRSAKFFLWLAIGLMLLCMFAIVVSAISNQMMPTESVVKDRLSEAEKARLAEFFHLRDTLGDQTWPGWGKIATPVLLYNEDFVFLAGYPNPPDGWLTIPGEEQVGGAWTVVPSDLFLGNPYYYQPLPESGEKPQAFTVKIGERWAASMTTKEWMAIALPQQMRERMSPLIEPIFPFFLLPKLFVGDSDHFISLIVHESFHAFQGTEAPERLYAAEQVVREVTAYPWEDELLQAGWREELNLLESAVRAESLSETAKLAGAFLVQREQRRASTGLTPQEINYERQREWSELSCQSFP